MLASIKSSTLIGIDSFPVDVEVDISYGLPVFNIVGLPEVSVRESKDRIKAAINNCGFSFPMERIVVNLAPADIKKHGSSFDLPIAVGILMASGLIPSAAGQEYLFSGELSLDGRIKPVRAILSQCLCAKHSGCKGIVAPAENASEAAMVDGLKVFPGNTLGQVVDFLSGIQPIPPVAMDREEMMAQVLMEDLPDFNEVKGQQQAKRALEIASAGMHHVLMSGPPGSGKSMLTKRIPGILPALDFDDAIEVTRIHSVMGLTGIERPWIFSRPFRSPHHTISDAGLAGGGARPLPGEITLAHRGVLFLDELPEFKRNVLEVMRQPLEDGRVSIVRAGERMDYPAQFMLVAAMNPCPCGYSSDPSGKCTCSPVQIQKYRSKISGPLLDRIDIHIEVPRVDFKDLGTRQAGESSAVVQKRVAAAWQIQEKRFGCTAMTSNANANIVKSNARMVSRHLAEFCPLNTECEAMLSKASDALNLSARACHSVLRVARTIADLEGKEYIVRPHLAEALQFRTMALN